MSATLTRADQLLGWWLKELAGCVPAGWRDRIFGARATLEIATDQTEACVRHLSRGNVVDLGRIPLGTASPGDLRECLRKLKQDGVRVPTTVVVRLPEDQILDVRIDTPALAAGHLDEVLALEMDRKTPFLAGDVFFDHAVLGTDASGERLDVGMRVARRSDVLRALDVARRLGVRATRVDGPDPPQRAKSAFNLLPADKRALPARLGRWLLTAAFVVLLVLAGAVTATGYSRLKAELSEVEATIAQLREQAMRVQSVQEQSDGLMAGLGALTTRRASRPTAAELIDEITRRTPDGHWLVAFRLEEDDLRVSGFSPAPSDLLRSLATSDVLEEVAFASPLVADQQTGAERFVIQATVSPRKASP